MPVYLAWKGYTTSMINRRNVIMAAAALAAVTFTSLTAKADVLKDRKGHPIKVGLQLYSVRNDCAKDLVGTLKAVAKMGFTGVEFAGYYGHTPQELKKLLDDTGLKCYGTHVDMNALTGDNLQKTLDYADGIGCKMVVVPWIPDNRRSTRAQIIDTAHFFGDVAKKAAERGIAIGWHNEDYEWKMVDGEPIWDIFWNNADKSVAMQFDTGNALSAGIQAAPYLLKHPKQIQTVHVKDFSSTNKNALLGEGDEHWNEVIPILKTKAPVKYFIVEQESYGEPPLVCVEKCLRNFEKLWKQF